MTSFDAPFRHQQVAIDGSSLHVVEAGDPDAPPVLFVHGWPESWRAWEQVMTLAAPTFRAIAVDLPGVGGSAGDAADGSKRALAAKLHRLVETLGLTGLTLVGHDAGGMAAYAYLRDYPELYRAVVMDVVVPGLPPWEQVLANPYVWHFGFHAVPNLPELLVQGRQRAYFDYFSNAIAARAEALTDELRDAHASAYASDSALAAGFSWYRTFSRDADDNRQSAGGPPVTTPLLYLRGEYEGGDLPTYVRGLQEAGMVTVEAALIPGSGHFAPEEAPAAVWKLISEFAAA